MSSVPHMSGCRLQATQGALAYLAVVPIVALLAGCSRDGRVPVSGTVTWNGDPIADGSIIFTPVDTAIGPDASAVRNGHFEFRSTPGEKRVEVFADRAVGAPDPVMHTQRREQYIPTRYNEQTELTARVTSDGENHFPFDLVSREGDEKAGGDAATSAND